MSESDNISWQSTSLADELLECFTFDKLSEEFIREIIERHELTPHHNNTVSNYRFFRLACCNEKITEGVIQYLLEYFPDAANDADEDGRQPLHHACNNDDVPLGVIQLLIDAAPDSVHREDDGGKMPLHILCNNPALDETKSMEIFHLLLEKCPESIRHAVYDGTFLPIHIAANRTTSPEFLSVLIEAYPGSERMAGPMGMLPIHFACLQNNVTTVEYLYKLYPDAIHDAASGAMYPIHSAMEGLRVDVVKFLLGCDPKVKLQEVGGRSLLFWACLVECNDSNIGAGLEIIEAIYDAHPEFIREKDAEGHLPLHCLCINKKFDGKAACEFLKLLLKLYPESIQHANNRGNLPIHFAALSKSKELCQLLIEAYPGSERMASVDGMLPIHYACMGGPVATVEYLYNLYPDSINHAAVDEREALYPIHIAINSMTKRGGVLLLDSFVVSVSPRGAGQEDAVDIVKFLLSCDPRVSCRRNWGGRLSLLLAWASFQEFNHENIGAALEIIKAIYDSHPEAIESDEMNVSMEELSSYEPVREFINSERIYSHLSKDRHFMTTPDDNGQLPLHIALRNNVRLGSIKLLVRGFPLAVLSPDNSGALPLHVACAYHESASVVQYLVNHYASNLEALDHDDNTALHYACLGAKYETIALLLRKYDAVSVSERNAWEELPIDLLFESSEVVDRESDEYTGSIFQLVKAYPETVMNWT